MNVMNEMETGNRHLAWAFVKMHIPIIYRVGPFRFYCLDQVSMWRADTLYTKEPETLSWIDRDVHPGMVFVDIGASTGIYSVYAAARGAVVWAYEPDPQVFKVLLKNVQQNRGMMFPCPRAVTRQEEIDVIPGAVKIDTDGREVEILEGSSSTLQKAKTIMIEESPENAGVIDSIMKGWGFVCESRNISEMMRRTKWKDYRNVIWRHGLTS